MNTDYISLTDQRKDEKVKVLPQTRRFFGGIVGKGSGSREIKRSEIRIR